MNKRLIRPLCLCGCGREVKRATRKYFSNKCQSDYQYLSFIERWKSGMENGTSGGVTLSVSDHIRRYLFHKYENKCARCGWCEVSQYTGNIPLEVEHIDGNPLNCTESNLILICPNCHSLTSTFRALNKNSPRKRK